MTDVQRRVAVAERAARAGGAVARQAYRGELSVSTKAERTDLVTDADVDAQRQVVASIVGEFPNSTIIAEEKGIVPAGVADDRAPEFVDEVPPTADCWVIDPIDGTTNFARGMEPWATAVAALVDGEPVAATTYLPEAGEIYTAGQDGAARDGTPLSVSDRTDPGLFVVTQLGRLSPSAAGRHGAVAEAAIERFGDLRRFGSMQTTLACVASGALDAAFTATQPRPWDTLGGVHLIRQAGGTVTDLDGDRWTRGSDSLVASNGEAHDAVRDVAATES